MGLVVTTDITMLDKGVLEMKTKELVGTQLDWAVARAEGLLEKQGANTMPAVTLEGLRLMITMKDEPYAPSWDWGQGGPIVEGECMSLEYLPGAGDGGADVWVATRIEGSSVSEEQGQTPLIAAMRCYVAAVLGDEVDIPEELL